MKNKALAAPYLVWMAIFTVVPLGIVIWFSFTDSITGAFTFDNISRMGTYLPIFLKSIWLAILSSLICLVIGYPVAYCLASAAPERQRFLYMLVMLPMCMSFLLRTLAWVAMLEDTGIFNSLLKSIGLSPLPLIRTDGAVVLGMVYNYLPFMILPIYSVIIKLDRSLLFHICTDKNAALFYQSIVSAFCRLGYRIVAEGVETQEEMELLRSWNVDMIQGYYFSRPLPPDDLLRLLTGSAEMQAENQA